MDAQDIFFLSFANNSDAKFLPRLKEEMDDSFEKLLTLKNRGLIDIHREESITTSDIWKNLIERYKNQIVIFHYGGHADGKALVFEDQKVYSKGLAGLLSTQKNLKLLFLNACNTFEQVEEYLSAEIKCVIATTLPVIDGHASLFAISFYSALANDFSIKDSFKAACDVLKSKYSQYESTSSEVIVYREIHLEVVPELRDSPWKLFVKDPSILNWKVTRFDRLRRLVRIGSSEYYQQLRNGRYKYLKISDILLAKIQTKFIDVMAGTESEGGEGPLYEILQKLWKRDVRHSVLLGEGGMGKTVSLIRLWEQLLASSSDDQPIPIFIALNEYNSVKVETDREKFLIKKIGKDYLNKEQLTAEDENILWALLKKPPRENEDYIPSVILFLDGFNELSGDKTKLLIELRDLVEKARATQIVVTSRYDMRNFPWAAEFELTVIKPLDEKTIRGYLSYVSHQSKVQIDYPAGIYIRKLLVNPFMLSLFTASAGSTTIYVNNKSFDFKSKVTTYGELMWNFMESQIAKYSERDELNRSAVAYYQFMIRHFLPYIGFRMEKTGKFFFLDTEIRSIISDACYYFYNEEFIKTFDHYRRYLKEFDINLSKKDFADIDSRIDTILDMLCENILMLVKENDSYRFLHQHFRDFFSTVHIINDVHWSLNRHSLPETLKERVIPVQIRRIFGEIEGQQYNVPVIKPDQKRWSADHYTESPSRKLIRLCKGIENDSETGFLIWNIITTWKEVRGELTGEDLSLLNLKKQNFADIFCFRNFQANYLGTDFSKSLLKKDCFFLQGHGGSITSIHENKAGSRCLTASRDKSVKEWDTQTGDCLYTWEFASEVYVARYYDNDSKIIIGLHNGDVEMISLHNSQRIKKIKNIFKEDVGVHRIETNESFILVSTYKYWIYVFTIDGIESRSLYSGRRFDYLDEKEHRIETLAFNSNNSRILKVTNTGVEEILFKIGIPFFQRFRYSNGKNAEIIIKAATYSSDGKQIIGVSAGGSIVTWLVGGKRGDFTFSGTIEFQEKISVDTIVFDPQVTKCLFFTASPKDKFLRQVIEVDLQTGKFLNTFNIYRDVISSIAYLKNGKEILVGSFAGVLYQFSTETGELICVFPRTPRGLTFSTFSFRGEKILCYSGNGLLHEFSSTHLTCTNQVKAHDFYIVSAYYTNENKIVSIAGNGEVKQYDHATGGVKLLTTLSDPPLDVLNIGSDHIVIRYYDHDQGYTRVDLLNLTSLETEIVAEGFHEDVDILCTGPNIIFIGKENLKSVYAYEIESQKMELVASMKVGLFHDPAVCYDSRTDVLYFGELGGVISVYQKKDNEWQHKQTIDLNTTGDAGRVISLNVFNEGRTLGFVRLNGAFGTYDVIKKCQLVYGELPRFSQESWNSEVREASFSPDASKIVYRVGTNNDSYLYTIDTGTVLVLSLKLGPLVCSCKLEDAKGLNDPDIKALTQYGAVFD